MNCWIRIIEIFVMKTVINFVTISIRRTATSRWIDNWIGQNICNNRQNNEYIVMKHTEYLIEKCRKFSLNIYMLDILGLILKVRSENITFFTLILVYTDIVFLFLLHYIRSWISYLTKVSRLFSRINVKFLVITYQNMQFGIWECCSHDIFYELIMVSIDCMANDRRVSELHIFFFHWICLLAEISFNVKNMY